MATVIEKLTAFSTAKETLRQALQAKGMQITAETPFSQWASKVTSLVGLDWDGTIASVSIGQTATSIRKYVFAGCTNLTNVSIPNNITTIDNDAFTYSSLTGVTFQGRALSEVIPGSPTVSGYPWGLQNGAVITDKDGNTKVVGS